MLDNHVLGRVFMAKALDKGLSELAVHAFLSFSYVEIGQGSFTKIFC